MGIAACMFLRCSLYRVSTVFVHLCECQVYTTYLPPQAVHCCLDGLHGKDFIDEDKALDAFDRLALNNVCIAQVMENSGARVSVELIDSESDGQQTINSLLLQDLCSQAKLTPILPEVSVHINVQCSTPQSELKAYWEYIFWAGPVSTSKPLAPPYTLVSMCTYPHSLELRRSV